MSDQLIKELEFKIEELQIVNEELASEFDQELVDHANEMKVLSQRIEELEEAIIEATSKVAEVEALGGDLAYYLKKKA